MGSETKDARATHGTFVVERTYQASPERVFRAWADPERKRRWFAEGEGFTVESFELDFRVGGIERSRFTPAGGPPLANDTYYHDIIDGRRIVFSYAMTIRDYRMSVSLATVELEPNGSGGTLLRYTEQGAYFEHADGPDIREQGWGSLLDALERDFAEH